MGYKKNIGRAVGKRLLESGCLITVLQKNISRNSPMRFWSCRRGWSSRMTGLLLYIDTILRKIV
jgi:hypothetical protein